MAQIGKIKVIWLLVVIALLIAGCSYSRENNDVVVPESAPVETEPNVETIPGDTQPSTTNPSNGGSVSLSYSNQVTIDLSRKTATLYFANPIRSNQDIILQIVVAGEVIAQSGLIPAGCQVTRLSLTPDVTSKIGTGAYSGKFVIYYYDQQTGNKAAVNTEIPIYILSAK